MSIRVVAITGTAVDGAGNPNTTGTVNLHLLSPGGVLVVHTATGDLINADPPNPVPDPTTAIWNLGVIPPGDMTPPGCEWQVTQGPGQPIVSPSFAYTASTIDVTTWVSSPSHLGLIKVYLTAVEGNALTDAGATFGVTINADAIWTGTGGSGQLVQAGAPPITAVVDSSGDVFYYLIPQVSLNPSSGYYQTPTRKQALYFTVPDTYTNADLGVTDDGTYASGTTYAANAIVRDPANNYEPYISLAGGNVGHTPSASPSFWGAYAGERITAHLTGPLVPGTIAMTGVGIAHDSAIAPIPSDPNQSPATLHDDLTNLVARIHRNGVGRKLYLFKNAR